MHFKGDNAALWTALGPSCLISQKVHDDRQHELIRKG